ncbi:MAG: excisionase family DNA-binding protein [Lachnospiraceae bacterium]|nr:excisionase family DNA-binding protein [Lachnospiraceae bacterium]
MTNGQISEFLLLLDRKTAIQAHSVSDWRPEYSQELREIERQLSVLRVAADQDRGRGSSGGDYVPTMITLTEAAKRTGLSYDHLRKLALNGKIRTVRAGNSKFLVNYERLLEYLDQGDREVNA